MNLAPVPRAPACVPFAVKLPDGSLPWPGGSGPAAVAARLIGSPDCFWLDSADARPGDGAWSYLGLAPGRVLEVHGREAVIRSGDTVERLAEARAFPLLARELDAWRAEPRPAAPGERRPPFGGGWFAVLAYDLGREIERIPARTQDDLPFPSLYLARHDTLLAFDHRDGTWWAAGLLPVHLPAGEHAAYAQAQAAGLLARFAALPQPRKAEPAPAAAGTAASNFTRAGYLAAVRRVLDYIAAGDIYQANLAQRFEAPWRAPAFELYRRLRAASPARYGVYAALSEGRALASISPELFLSMRGREVLTRPIKGTRPRGATPAADAALAAELEASPKDRAELTMIVDLERNDLGRVCDYGSVRVVSAGELERHPTVFHRTAAIAGRLHHRRGAAELLRAMFPGGSVTGAPKIRAMQIIEELEPTRRGPYCGALGWLGANGDLELNLAIRTVLVDERAGRAWYQAGGGIVADSDPRREYEETLAKAAAFFSAANLAPPVCP